MLKILELFGGIGACSKALERLGIEYEIADYVEIDKYAVKSFNAIHGTNFEPQDICEWDKDIDVDLVMHGSPCQDFSLAGLQAGGDEGSGTRSSLMYETVRIVEKLKPKYVIWENVKNLLSKKHKHNFDAYLEIMENLGYRNFYQVLNAKDYGIPQNRERVFTISIRNDINLNFVFPEKQDLKLKLKDMLQDNVEQTYYLSEKNIDYICGNALNKELKDIYHRENALFNKNISYTINTKNDRRLGDTNYILEGYEEITCKDFLKIRNNTKKGYLEARDGDGINISSRMKYQRGNVQKDLIQTITTSGGNDRGVVVNDFKILDDRDKGWGVKVSDICPTQRASRSGIKCITPDLRIRKLTPKECWRLMGFDDEDFDKSEQVNSNTQLYKQAGNSIVVNVLEAILNNLLIDNKENKWEDLD